MKIRVTDSNKQQHEIYFEEITSVFAMPYSDDSNYDSIMLQLDVDTIDRKELHALQPIMPVYSDWENGKVLPVNPAHL